MRDASGQTTIEYAGLLLLVAALTAGAGSLVGLGAVADAVASGVRTGICIVAGDICRASDAAAAGLAPCTLREHQRGRAGSISLAVVRVGMDGTWTVTARSDGSVLVVHARGARGGVHLGTGFEASPVGIGFGVGGKAELTIEGGAAWEFPDAAAAARFLAGDREAVEPAWRFGGAGARLGAEAEATLGGITAGGLHHVASSASGMRVGRGRVTYYHRVRQDAIETAPLVPVNQRRTTGEVLVELTRDAGGLREIAFRSAERVDDRLVETVARLDLREHANRDAAAELVGVPWEVVVSGRLRELARRAVATGIVERAVYALEDRSQSLELAARLGASLGIKAEEIDLARRLVGASAWTHGSRERERADCGVTGAPLERTS